MLRVQLWLLSVSLFRACLPACLSSIAGVCAQALGGNWALLPPPTQLDQLLLLLQDSLRAAGPEQT
jgi:hypothetical protein